MLTDRLEIVAASGGVTFFDFFQITGKILRVFPKKLPKKRFRPVLKGKNIFFIFFSCFKRAKLNKNFIKKIFFRLKIFEKKIKNLPDFGLKTLLLAFFRFFQVFSSFFPKNKVNNTEYSIKTPKKVSQTIFTAIKAIFGQNKQVARFYPVGCSVLCVKFESSKFR